MDDSTGIKQGNDGVGYKKPPVETRFGKPKGNRINRKGRPKNFDQLRTLAQKIADEALLTPEGKITRIEALLRVLTSSRAPADRALFLAYAYGKPREQIDVNIPGATITLNWRTLEKDDEHNPPPATSTPG